MAIGELAGQFAQDDEVVREVLNAEASPSSPDAFLDDLSGAGEPVETVGWTDAVGLEHAGRGVLGAYERAGDLCRCTVLTCMEPHGRLSCREVSGSTSFRLSARTRALLPFARLASRRSEGVPPRRCDVVGGVMKGSSLERLHEPRASESAQATLEMALCTVALLGMIIGVAVIWRAAERGVLAKLVEEAASHGLDVAGAIDAALF